MRISRDGRWLLRVNSSTRFFDAKELNRWPKIAGRPNVRVLGNQAYSRPLSRRVGVLASIEERETDGELGDKRRIYGRAADREDI